MIPIAQELIISRREALGLNKTQASALCGLNIRMYSNYETGNVSLSDGVCRRIAIGLGLDPEYLVDIAKLNDGKLPDCIKYDSALLVSLYDHIEKHYKG
jgi:transcriptional regulator with XRE-family HTH domain